MHPRDAIADVVIFVLPFYIAVHRQLEIMLVAALFWQLRIRRYAMLLLIARRIKFAEEWACRTAFRHLQARWDATLRVHVIEIGALVEERVDVQAGIQWRGLHLARHC